MNENIKIEDGFLDRKSFEEIETYIVNPESYNPKPSLPWRYTNGVDGPNETEMHRGYGFQFVHVFYANYQSVSESTVKLAPILEKIRPVAIHRIKANLLVRTPEIIEHRLHSDMHLWMPEEKQKEWTTSIFYMNTCNGYTKFEDGTKVESVANRMVTFPADMKHTGTSCTDQNTRIVINFNYFYSMGDYKPEKFLATGTMDASEAKW